jgi:predicted protein tyrosine phosphatase
MEIEICGRGTVAGVMSTAPQQRDLLVISNPGSGLPSGVEPLARRLLHLEFDDFSEPREGVVLVTSADIERVLDWAQDHQNLVVCCHAGVSRSSAMAYVIACRTRSPAEALTLLLPGWHYPNERIVRLGAEVLGNKEVYSACLAWLGGPATAGTSWRRQLGA